MSSRQPIKSYQIDVGQRPAQVAVINNGGTISVSPTASVQLDNDLTTKAYVDAIARGLYPHESVKAATTQSVVLSGEQAIDGVNLTAGQRVLVLFGSETRTGTSSPDNGIWIVNTGAWTRAADFDNLPDGEVTRGDIIPVTGGSTHVGSTWMLITQPPIVIGTTPLQFTELSPTFVRMFVEKSGDTMTGPLVLSGAPQTALHAATKGYVDTTVSTSVNGRLALTGGTMQGAIAMGGQKVTGLAAASAAGDALSWGGAANVSSLSVNGTTIDFSSYLTNANLSAYMPKTGGTFSGVVKFGATITEGPGGDYGTILSAGPYGSNVTDGAHIVLCGPSAHTSGWGADRSVNITGSSLFFNNNNLGRWGAVDPATKVDLMAGGQINLPAIVEVSSGGRTYGGRVSVAVPNAAVNGGQTRGFVRVNTDGTNNLSGNFIELNVQDGGTWQGGISVAATGVAYGADFQASSDASLKKHVAPRVLSLTEMSSVEAKEWDWIDGSGHSSGAIAQDIERILPELVHRTKDGTLSISDGKVAVVLALNLARCLVEVTDRLDALEVRLNKPQ